MSAEFPNDPRDLMEQLDRALPPHTRAAGDADGSPLVDAAQRLAQGPDVALSEAALDRIEARLRQRTAELARPAQRSGSRPVIRNTRRLLRFAVAACLIVILALGGITRASANSLPGDTLYPAKRAVEAVRLALVSKQSEPGLRVTFAERRLDEFETLLDGRRKVYPKALEEASDQMARALDLLAAGPARQTHIDQRLASLTHQQAALIQRAAPAASFEDLQRLQLLAGRNAALQQRLVSGGGVPDFEPDTTPTPTPTATLSPVPSAVPTLSPTPSASPTATPTLTPTATPTATPTVTPTHTPTPSPTRTLTPTGTLACAPIGTLTPSCTLTPTATRTPVRMQPGGAQLTLEAEAATRTPPGHGPTPGLGDNPPGHGGDNPGVGQGGGHQGGGHGGGKK